MQTIQYNNNLLDFKNQYIEAAKAMQGKPYQIELSFKQPETLYYSKWMRDNKVEAKHTVKRLFFLRDGLANCEHDTAATPDGAYYIAGRSRYGGKALPLRNLDTVTFITKAEPDYRKQWQAIADSMKKYGINPDIAAQIEQGVQGKSDCTRDFCKQENMSPYHTHFAQNYWDMKKDKPKTLDFTEVLSKITGHPEILLQGSWPIKEYEAIKKQHVKDHAIEALKKRASESEYSKEYVYAKVSQRGQKRDKSVSMQIYADGRIWYYAASEYAGCGNGDYYTMYSPTMAVYNETD